MLIRSVALAFTLVFVSSAVLAQKSHTFARGTVSVTLPDGFTVSERPDGSLLATFGSAGDHRVELSLSEVPSQIAGTSVGEEFVRSQAQKKNRRLSETAGKVVFMDPAGDSREGDRVFRTVHWQIGFGNSVVVMTLSAPAQGSAELNSFLGKPLNDVVNSLRRTAA